MFRTFVTGIGAVLMSITAWLLGLAGLLFDWLVYHTIIVFTDSFYNSVSTGINTGWRIFRDIGNIMIIGTFVFLAISMILGLKNYGDKKLIANLILVAVLINFSLLFTKIIVDFSNFTATQFYAAAKFDLTGTPNNIATLQAGDSKCQHSPTSSFTNCGIAGAFIAMSGVTGLADAYDKLNSVAQTSDNGWKALLYGLISAVLFAGAAFILFYGSFIILMRALLIIFLLLTSSLAFLSYIIPNKQFVEKGWKLWWDSLLKISILAPLLMVFLFIVTQIIATLNINGTGTTLGKLASDPNSNTIGALFNYLIVLGLLFASFKISNSIASGVAGMNMSSMMAGAMKAVGTFTRVPGLGYALGRFGYARADNLQAKAQSASSRAVAPLNEMKKFEGLAEQHRATSPKLAAQYDEQAKIARNEAERHLRQSSRLGRRSANAANWASTKSYSKRLTERAKAAGSALTRATPDAGKARTEAEKQTADANATRLQAQKAVLDEATRAAAAESQVVTDARAQRDTAQKARDEALLAASKAAGRDHSEMQPNMPPEMIKVFKDEIATIGDASTRSRIETKLETAISPESIKAIRQEIVNSVDAPQKAATQAALSKAEDEHQSGMRMESARIEAVRQQLIKDANTVASLKTGQDFLTAEKKLNDANALLGVANTRQRDAERNKNAQQAAYNRIEAEVTKAAKEAGQAASDAATEAAKRVAERIGARGVNRIPNILDRSASAAALVKTVRVKKTEERLSDILKEVAKEQQSNEPTSSTGTTT